MSIEFKEDNTYEYTVTSDGEVVHTENGTYSINNKSANLFADNIEINSNGCYKYQLYLNSQYITDISLSAPGKHNILNSLATAGSIYANKLNILDAKESIENFTGASRRFEYKKTI